MDGLTGTNTNTPTSLNNFSLRAKTFRDQSWQYGVLVLTVFASLAIEWLVPDLFRRNTYLLYWAVVAFNAWYGGIGAGSLASFLGVLLADFFLHTPFHFNLTLEDFIAVGVGLLITALINIPPARRQQVQRLLEQAYARVEQDRQRMSTILSSISDAYIALDRDYRFTYLSPQGASLIMRLTGKSSPELIGKTLWEIVPNSESSQLGADYRRVLEHQSPGYFEEFFPSLNSWFEVRVYPYPNGLNIYFQEITERKQNETSLRENEARLRRVLENMPVLLSVNDANGARVFWNKEAERVTGYSAEEMVGNPHLADLLYPDPEYQKQIDRFRAERRGDWRNWELETHCKDGTVRFISWSNISKHYPVPGWHDWVLGVDVTEQSRAQVELERLYVAEQKARSEAEQVIGRLAVLQTATVALSNALTADQVANIIFNHAIVELEAVRAAFVLVDDDTFCVVKSVGMPDSNLDSTLQFRPDDDVPVVEAVRTRQPLWLQTGNDGKWFSPYSLTNVESDDLNGLWAILPLCIDGRAFGALCLNFPSSRQISQEDRVFLSALVNQCAQALERMRLFNAESDARKEAETANMLKLQFLGMISHELRTPLSSIKGFASTLLAEDVDFDASSKHEFLTVIDQEADHLSELVEQLLDLSRLQASSMRINAETHTFDEIVKAAMPELKMLLAYHEFVLDIEDGLPAIMVDVRRIVQVITNLVANAVHHAPTFTPITLRARHVGNIIQVDVIDQGAGIPPEEHQHVFEAFRQGDSRLDKHSQGAGLGLAICKGLVEAHGGKIWIHNQPPPGATLSFTLPIAE